MCSFYAPVLQQKNIIAFKNKACYTITVGNTVFLCMKMWLYHYKCYFYNKCFTYKNTQSKKKKKLYDDNKEVILSYLVISQKNAGIHLIK